VPPTPMIPGAKFSHASEARVLIKTSPVRWPRNWQRQRSRIFTVASLKFAVQDFPLYGYLSVHSYSSSSFLIRSTAFFQLTCCATVRPSSASIAASGADPIGPDNDKHLVAMAKASHIVVFAYGQPGHRTLGPRGQLVARLLMEKAGITPHILKLSKGGIPTHPLYLLESLEPVVWPL
jgi:Protein of unknown function (DUF1643)